MKSIAKSFESVKWLLFIFVAFRAFHAIDRQHAHEVATNAVDHKYSKKVQSMHRQDVLHDRKVSIGK